MSTRPYLSIIAVGRNDDYGKDFSKRLDTFLRHLARLDHMYPGLFELIFVEWNPPPEKPPLAKAFDWSRFSQARIITVTPDRHRTIPFHDRTYLFEYFAKNVGVRRAQGDYVLVTNPDIIFSDELFAFFATKPFVPETFYRIDRCDFHPQAAFEAPADKIYAAAVSGAFVIHVRHGTDRTKSIGIDVKDKPQSEWSHSEMFPGDRALGPSLFATHNTDTVVHGLHTNGAGDFLLMHKTAWEKVRGYPERPEFSSHIDGHNLAHAYAVGLQQVILVKPFSILHMDHSRPGMADRPNVEYAKVEEEFNKICQEKIPNPNSETWGMSGVDLPEWSPRGQDE